MTPEERATEVVTKWYKGPYNLHVDASAMLIEITDVAAAIQLATMAAYEHAAQVAYDLESGKVTSQKTVAQALRTLAEQRF